MTNIFDGRGLAKATLLGMSFLASCTSAVFAADCSSMKKDQAKAVIQENMQNWRETVETLERNGLHPTSTEDVLVYVTKLNPDILRDPAAKGVLFICTPYNQLWMVKSMIALLMRLASRQERGGLTTTTSPL